MSEFAADIFGGTFDPVQQGHIELVRSAILKDRVLVIAPTTQNPWKERKATDLDLRLEMLRIALKAENIEFHEHNPRLGSVYLANLHYTFSVELLRWWKERYGKDLRWLVGPGDKASSANWHNWNEEGCEVIEFTSNYQYHSSDVRSGAVAAHPAIKEFIKSNKLYSC